MTLKRMTFLQEMLDFVGLGGRLHLEWISSAEAQKFVQVVSEFTEKIRRLGPNPLLGFTQPDMILRPRAVKAAAGDPVADAAAEDRQALPARKNR
jgi:F420-non-reducing hydrogenase iron-sulfur subunit